VASATREPSPELPFASRIADTSVRTFTDKLRHAVSANAPMEIAERVQRCSVRPEILAAIGADPR
jgi:hypothetical protein